MNKLALLTGTSALVLSLAMDGSAFAQAAADQPANAESIETVVVSASRISIAGYTAPTPVTTVDAGQLTSAANLNLGETLRQLPAMGNVLTPEQGSDANASNSGALGISNVNLRNLGTNRDLVLFDGQRMVSPIVTGGADLSVIPISVVQRVDVVTGGASAAWGSDAVSGVVNLIIDKTLHGLKGSIDAGDRGWGASQNYGGTLTYGSDVFGGRGHFIIAGTYNDYPNTVFLGRAPWWKSVSLFNNPAWTA
ncbi:MAG: TonB-dependent receptor plug domain-containing protein, partial [Rhizomicrobium sp.]